ncbi:MAG: DnaJ domain-containing protein [Acidobacteria bacterium]|nr:DnaJ domain-containing protein [Acidobacteriota bacterium]
MLARDHYATLGVPPTATDDDIDTAYRHLSRRYHPDINPGDPHAAAVYERLEAAYRVLSDPERRERYDAEGAPRELEEAAGPDLHVRLVPDGDDQHSYQDLFRLLRDHARRAGAQPGDDIHTNVDVPLLQAGRGRRVRVAIHRSSECLHCGGRGRVQLQRSRPCQRCGGAGEESFVKGSLSVTCACADCEGSGLATGKACAGCGGTGATSSPETVLVRVPAGATDGQQIRISGDGHRGLRGGPAGDLVVRVRIMPLPGWERIGTDLHGELSISFAEAVLGAKIRVPLPDGGSASLRVPPNTPAGYRFKLRGRGLEVSDGERGDMLLRAVIRGPEVLDEESRDLIREFASRHPFDPRIEPVRESQQ